MGAVVVLSNVHKKNRRDSITFRPDTQLLVLLL